MDIKAVLKDYVDHLVPRLDCYEQTLYVYLLRQSHLADTPEVTVGFKSARRKMGFGIGTKGHGMSEGTCYEKLQSLQKKGCLRILDSTTAGTKLRVMLPAEIPGVLPSAASIPEQTASRGAPPAHGRPDNSSRLADARRAEGGIRGG